MKGIPLLYYRALLLIGLVCAANQSYAVNQDFIGEWNIVINQVTGGKRIQNGLLLIDYKDNEYIAHVQGGPIRIILKWRLMIGLPQACHLKDISKEPLMMEY